MSANLPSPSVTPASTLPTVIITMAWRSYLTKLRSDPLMTKALTSALLSVCSDLFAKRMMHIPVRSSSALNELTAGLILRGPLIHAFHSFLDNLVFKNKKQSSVSVVLAKLFVDQFLFAPVFTSLYFYLRALFEDRALASTTQQLKKDLLGIMKSNWCVWIPANFVNYLFVPLELRVLFGSIVSCFWNAYLISRASARIER